MKISARTLVGSDLTITWAIFMHLFEGAVLLTIYPVPKSIPMASFVAVFSNQFLAGAVLWIATGMACFGQWCPHRSSLERFFLLFPQETLLIITAWGAVYFIAHGHYADSYVPASPLFFMLPDQISRIGMPFLYAAALFARIRNGA